MEGWSSGRTALWVSYNTESLKVCTIYKEGEPDYSCIYITYVWRKYQICTINGDWSWPWWCSEFEWSCRFFYSCMFSLWWPQIQTLSCSASSKGMFFVNYGYTPAVYSIVFVALDASVVHATALCTVGVTGPSRFNAPIWRWLCTSFGSASDKLCGVIALFYQETVHYIHFSRYSLVIFGMPTHCCCN